MNCNPGRIVVNYCKKIPSANKGAISGCRALSAGDHVGGYDVQPIRVGILGPGNIVRRVMTDFHRAERVVLSAVASRDGEKAQKAARAYGAPLAFDSYEAMARSDQVDLVYLATPHSLHYEQAMMCMKNGKHVLCEKPMVVNEAQALSMAQCARENGVFLMEAMWSRFFPAAHKLRALLEAGAIGDIWHITANFSSRSGYDPASRLYRMDLAGGALLDIGVYPLMAVTGILGWNPQRVQGLCVRHACGVDVHESVQLQYESGATAQIFSGLMAPSDQKLTVFGSKGRIEMPGFWHPVSLSLFETGKEEERFAFPAENEGFYHEFDHAAQCIEQGLIESPLMTHAESAAVARITEGLRREWGVLYPGEEA